jgi:hypothetical protein
VSQFKDLDNARLVWADMEDHRIEPDLPNANAVRAFKLYREKLEAEGRAPAVEPLQRKPHASASKEPDASPDDAAAGGNDRALPGGG